MTFTSSTYANFVSAPSEVQRRLFPQYRDTRTAFDIIIVGSGMGGGVLADDLADRFGKSKRILVLEAGSYLFPTHVYNVSRFDNGALARHFAHTVFIVKDARDCCIRNPCFAGDIINCDGR